jgi:hypothetical protein
MDEKHPPVIKKNKGGRGKKAPITYDQVYELAKEGCSIQEIARILCVNESTIDMRFADAWGCGHAEMQLELRKKQLELARKGNVTMLIFLGKAYLNQFDKVQTESTVTQTTKYESTDELKKKLNDLVVSRLNHYRNVG